MTFPEPTSRPGLPAHWAADPYWRAAMEILAGFPADDARIWAHVSPAGIDYRQILDEGWSGGQRRILRAAASLWDGTPVSLLDILAGVSDVWWERISEAMSILRDGLR